MLKNMPAAASQQRQLAQLPPLSAHTAVAPPCGLHERKLTDSSAHQPPQPTSALMLWRLLVVQAQQHLPDEQPDSAAITQQCITTRWREGRPEQDKLARIAGMEAENFLLPR